MWFIVFVLLILIIIGIGTLLILLIFNPYKDELISSLEVLCLLSGFSIMIICVGFDGSQGLPRSVNDMKSGEYRLLTYDAEGDTVNAFLMGANNWHNPHAVWGVAVPKRQWMVKDHPTVVYISEVTINGNSKVVITDSPPKLP